MIDKSEEILKDIEEYTADEEKIKLLTKDVVVSMMDTCLSEFHLVQPSQFFKDHPTNDSELICSI